MVIFWQRYLVCPSVCLWSIGNSANSKVTKGYQRLAKVNQGCPRLYKVSQGNLRFEGVQWPCMQFHKLAYSFKSLHAISRSCIQFHEHECSSIILYLQPRLNKFVLLHLEAYTSSLEAANGICRDTFGFLRFPAFIWAQEV